MNSGDLGDLVKDLRDIAADLDENQARINETDMNPIWSAARLREAAAALERAGKLALTPERVENLRSRCHADYNGGHRTPELIEAFHHGMDTVCNALAAIAEAAA